MDELLNRITQLQKSLMDLGYHPFQLKDILVETVGTTHVEQLNTEQCQKLIEALEEYLQFATKCKTRKEYHK